MTQDPSTHTGGAPGNSGPPGGSKPGPGSTAVIAPDSGPSTRVLIMLSAMMPGLGQLMQKRWLAAAVYGVGFTWPCVLVIVRVIRSLLATVQAAIAFADRQANAPFVALSPRAIVIPLVLALLFYVGGLVDTYWASQRKNQPPPPTVS